MLYVSSNTTIKFAAAVVVFAAACSFPAICRAQSGWNVSSNPIVSVTGKSTVTGPVTGEPAPNNYYDPQPGPLIFSGGGLTTDIYHDASEVVTNATES
jgi:hypothetical protein